MSTENHAESLQKMQIIEQQLHAQTAQRAAFQSQLLETENAAREVTESKDAYRIIGNIMVKSDSAKLKSELEERKATLQTRIAAVERHEKSLREEMDRLQKQILGA
jgi:prefoldin beta subunit